MLKYLILFSFVLCGTWAFDGTIYDFIVPLKYENSGKKGYIKGKIGYYLNESDIQIKDMQSLTYAGNTEGAISTRTSMCVFKRDSNTLSGEQKFFLDYLNLDINGMGFDWDLSTQYLIIKNNVTVDVIKQYAQ